MHQNWLFVQHIKYLTGLSTKYKTIYYFPLEDFQLVTQSTFKQFWGVHLLGFGHVLDEIDPSFNLGSICTHSWQIYRDMQSRVALRISSAAWNTPNMPLLQVGPCGDAVGWQAPYTSCNSFPDEDVCCVVPGCHNYDKLEYNQIRNKSVWKDVF